LLQRTLGGCRQWLQGAGGFKTPRLTILVAQTEEFPGLWELSVQKLAQSQDTERVGHPNFFPPCLGQKLTPRRKTDSDPGRG